ncbi:integrase/recombinase xerD homolog [Littorina saxatilis]|uniref:integrase/recombinase xerD homolog n=1 Tax=Littorina saxatilis TaxID=31220 RepID=UPI0038B5DADD
MLIGKALSASSINLYKRAWQLFKVFTAESSLTWEFPVSEQTVLLFIAYLYHKGYAPATISSMMSALSYIHKLASVPDPTSSYIVRKSMTTAHKLKPANDSRLPITEDILEQLVKTSRQAFQNVYLSYLYPAMFLLAFHAFLRVGEITESDHTLAFSDVTLTDKSITISFRSAKHSAGKHQEAVVTAVDNAFICPVQALKQYIGKRGCMTGPLFMLKGRSLLRREFVTTLKAMLNIAGIPAGRFNSHSFRIGAATSSAAKGASDAQIRKLGRWQSDAFKRYIRLP